jgi:HEAT repeat protein
MRRFVFCFALGGCATLGLAGVGGAADTAAEALARLDQLIDANDVQERAIAYEHIRRGMKGEASTARFAARLSALPADRQIELLRALADRGDAAALPAIAKLAEGGDPAVRSAALQAIGGLGSGESVGLLVKALAATDPEKAAARRALVILRGDDATRQVVAALASAPPAVRAHLLDIMADRRARAAVPELVGYAADADPGVRAAAMRALAKLGGPEQVPGMVKGLFAAAAGQERTDAERALVTVCTQSPGHEQATESFLTIFKTASDADREVLLSPLGRIGGPGAMAVVDALLADTDPAEREFGLVALTRWPDATVAPKLLGMVANAPDAATRDRLLGALIRIAPLPDNKLNDNQKLELLQKTMKLCEKDADRGKVIERANAIRTVETFRFVLPYLDEPSLAEPACKSVVELAHHQKLRDAHKDDFTKALDKVIATTKNPELVERANRYKEGKTWARK